MVINDIIENFDEFCDELYEEISIHRLEKKESEISKETVQKRITQLIIVFIVALYRLVATTCTSEQSEIALDSFSCVDNTNYQLQNLFMQGQIKDFSPFTKRAMELDKKMKEPLKKSLIKFAVREFFMNHDIEIYGQKQSVFDYFFPNDQNIKMAMAKKRIQKETKKDE